MKFTERQILELFIEKELELKELKEEVKRQNELSDFWYKEYNELERAKNGNSEEATED